MIPSTVASSFASAFAEDVRRSLRLTPRQLPSQYLYDALGSALFDAICELPWYGITRAENRLLARHREEIFAHLGGLTRIVELGPGDGRKLQTLVEGTSDRLTAHLIDVSAGALARAAHTLSDALHVAVVTHRASFEDGLDTIAREIRRAAFADAQVERAGPSDRTLVLLLGSNIGNFDPPASAALLDHISASLARGNAFLMGADLVKPERDLLRAYNDPLGVSGAFNLNVLLRINRELGGDFDLGAFHHRAVWNAACSRMEMFAVSKKAQHVRIEAIDLNIDLEDGEAIWTESSYKYTAEELIDRLENAGFEPVAQWIDRDDAFALTLARTI
jgi:L-histidine Nalpha-methyltransferase